SDHHLRSSGTNRRRHRFHGHLRNGPAPVLEFCLAVPGVPGRFHWPDQAAAFWLHHSDRGLLLRTLSTRRDPGRGPGNHPGSSRVFCFHFAGRFLRDQILNGNFWLPLIADQAMSSPPTPVEERTSRTQGSQSPVIVFEDVSIAFQGKQVLDGISFRLPRGETKAIFGVAGSGKSTILKMAIGLLKPDAGRIYLLGEEVTQKPEEELFELRSKVGIVFQESALFDSLTVRENVAFRLMEKHDLSEEEIERRVREALSFVELENTIDMFPSELSGGMRRRVAIARAIITQPEILLYDSPTGGLDPITSTTIIELIMKQRDVNKSSSLLVSHRLQDGFMLATHYYDTQTKHMQAIEGQIARDLHTTFLILKDGKVIFDETIAELGRVRDPYIRQYLFLEPVS